MKHKFKVYYRYKDNSFRFTRFGESILIEYRPRLMVFDLIYYPDINKLGCGKGRFIRVIKHRSPDFLELCGIISTVLDTIDSPQMVEELLVKTTSETPCA